MKKITINNIELKNKVANNQYSVFKKLCGNGDTVVCSNDEADDVEHEFTWDYDAAESDYTIEDYTPSTLQEFAAYVNEYNYDFCCPIFNEESDKVLADIVKRNGWVLDFGKRYGVCHNGNEYVVLNDECEAEYIDNYVNEAASVNAIDYDAYCANNPDSSVNDDNWADWKRQDDYRGFSIDIHCHEDLIWKSGKSYNEVVVRNDVRTYVLCNVTQSEVYAWIDNKIDER